MAKSLVTRISKGASILFLSAALGNVISFFYKIILARWLQPSEYGILSIILMMIGIASVLFAFGIPTAVTQKTATHLAKKDNITALYSASLKLVIILSLVSSLLLFLFAKPLAAYLLKDVSLAYLLRIVSIAIFFYIISSYLNGLLLGFQRIGYSAIVQMIEKPSKLIATILLLYLGFRLNGAIYGIAIGALTMAIVGFALVKKAGACAPLCKLDFNYAKSFLSFSFPIFIGGLGGLFLSWTDTFLLSLLRSPVDVGNYNVALPTIWVLSTLITSLTTVLFPLFAEHNALQEHKKVSTILERAIKYIVYVTLPASAGMFLLADNIIMLLFGPNYSAAIAPFKILALGSFFFSINSLLNIYFISVGRPKTFMKFSLMATVVNIILNVILIQNFGIVGAAAATTSSMGLISFLALKKIKSITSINYSFALKSLASIAVMLIFAFACVKLLHLSLILKTILIVISSIFVYFGVLILVKGFDEIDINIFKEILHKISAKLNF